MFDSVNEADIRMCTGAIISNLYDQHFETNKSRNCLKLCITDFSANIYIVVICFLLMSCSESNKTQFLLQ